MLEMPSSPEAERSILGAIIVEVESYIKASAILTAEFFYITAHQIIFKAMGSMFEKHEPIDAISLSQKLKDDGTYESVGGVEYLTRCVQELSTAAHADHYSKIIARLYYERKIIAACHRLASDGESKYLDEITKCVTAKEGLEVPATFDYKKNLFTYLDLVLAKKDRADVLTHFGGIDSVLIGMRPGEINTWAAAPNVGKSMMLLNLMHHAALNGRRCLYVGTEMSAHETVGRHLSISSGIEPWKIRKAHFGPNDIARAQNAIGDIMYPMHAHILDMPEPSLREIEGAITSSKAEIVFLDYLERFTLPKAENMRLRVKEFMRGLKTMMRRKNVVAHLAAQLNREAYGKEDSRPKMSQLSESSAVEKESDRVFLMWTPKQKQEGHNNETIIELIFEKDRHGRKGVILDLELNHMDLTIKEIKNAL